MEEIIDYRGKSPKKTSSGVPLITAKIIKNGRLNEPDEFIAEKDYDDWMRRGLPRPGDIVMTTEAPLGEVAQLDGRKFALAQRVIVLRGKQGVLDNTFLKFLLQHDSLQKQLRARSSGTTVLGIRQSELRKISLTLPSVERQKVIAEVLGALDDKIELNRRMNETLEGMARALFQSWFVDFDPVRARQDGRTPAGLDESTAALFPSKFQDSELGLIPQGWRAGKLGEVALNPRRGVGVERILNHSAYIGLEHMPRRSIALSEWGPTESLESNKSEFKRGEILFGKLRPYFHKVGVAPVDGVCSTDILVIAPELPEWFGFVLGHLSSVDLIKHVDALSSGTRMPRTKWEDIAGFDVVLPPTDISSAFTRIIRPFVDRIIENIHQSRTLAELREVLLPKLLSGEILLSS